MFRNILKIFNLFTNNNIHFSIPSLPSLLDKDCNNKENIEWIENFSAISNSRKQNLQIIDGYKGFYQCVKNKVYQSCSSIANCTQKYIYKTILMICIMLIVILVGKWIFKLDNPDILVDTDSQYSRIWVKQIATNKTTYKTLQVDTGLESYIDAETGEMGAKYLRFYDLFEYFNKDAQDLTLTESAVLSGLISAPSKNNPLASTQNAQKMAGIVLDIMLDKKTIEKI